MSEAVERAARAMHPYTFDGPIVTPATLERRETLRGYARAAITALHPIDTGELVARLREDLALIPCQTKGPEDAESGCCAPCRARAERLSVTVPQDGPK